MEEFSFWIRLLNCLLSGLVAGLCFLKLENTNPDKARNARIAGLGIICVSLSVGSFQRRFEEFTPRILLLTIGLMFCFYGMRRMAVGEKPQYRIRKTR